MKYITHSRVTSLAASLTNKRRNKQYFYLPGRNKRKNVIIVFATEPRTSCMMDFFKGDKNPQHTFLSDGK
jgi:hypothetical protein